MGSAFGWIGTIFEFMLDLVPRLEICRANHAGVRFKRGKIVSEVVPGLYWYWPLVTEIVLLPTARQTLNLPAQKLTTKDGVTVAVEGAVVYQVRNIKQALVDTWDHDDTISDVALKVLVSHVCRRSFDDFREDLADDAGQKALTAACHDELKPFGVRVLQFFVSDYARCKVFAHVGGGFAVEEDE